MSSARDPQVVHLRPDNQDDQFCKQWLERTRENELRNYVARNIPDWHQVDEMIRKLVVDGCMALTQAELLQIRDRYMQQEFIESVYSHYDEIRAEYDRALQELKAFATDRTKELHRIAQDNLCTDAEKAATTATYGQLALLTDMLVQTKEVLEYPEQKQFQRDYVKLYQRVNGERSLSRMVGASLEIFFGALLVLSAGACMAIAAAVCPAFLIPAVVFGAFGVAFITEGALALDRQNELAKEKAYPDAANAMRLFSRKMQGKSEKPSFPERVRHYVVGGVGI